jgi:hypothetical protein
MKKRGRMADSPRPIGRPRLDRSDTSTKLSLTLPSRQYDELYTRAKQSGISVGEAIRRKLADDDRDDE